VSEIEKNTHMSGKKLVEVNRLKDEITAELKLCRSAWVYMSLKCRDMNATEHALDVSTYFNTYYPQGFTKIHDPGNTKLLLREFLDRINELREQLSEVISIISDANAQ
jgi:hypothetical protein